MLATKLLKSPPQRAACADPPARQAMKAMAKAYFDIRIILQGMGGRAVRDHAREPDSRQSGKSSPEPIAACLRQIKCARPLPQPIEMSMPMRISMLMSMSSRMLAVLALLCLTVMAASAQTRD